MARHRWNRCGVEGVLSQSDLRLHFGLGSAAIMDVVSVSSPDGTTRRFEKLLADRFHVLKEGGTTSVTALRGTVSGCSAVQGRPLNRHARVVRKEECGLHIAGSREKIRLKAGDCFLLVGRQEVYASDEPLAQERFSRRATVHGREGSLLRPRRFAPPAHSFRSRASVVGPRCAMRLGPLDSC